MARQRHDPFKDLVGFLLGDVMYAVRVEVVREIVNPLDIVDLPRAPASVKGVADYRGEVVPVIDLRERFGLPAIPLSRKTKWVVLDVSGGPNSRTPTTRQPLPAAIVLGAPDGADSSPPALRTNAPSAGRTGPSKRLVAASATDAPVPVPSLAPPGRSRTAMPACYAALVVDSVTEVFGLASGALRPAPPLGEGDERRGIEGVTNFGSRLVFVLDARAFGAVAHTVLSWAPGIVRASLESS
jgi:chemotaxis signal transduction protein